MATILNRLSDKGGPDVRYIVNATYSNRTATTVKVNVSMRAELSGGSPYLGKGKPIIGYIYLGGAWRSLTIKSSTASWSGNGTGNTVSGSYTISAGITATAITGIQFKADQTGGSAGDMSAKACSNLAISSGVSAATTNHSGVAITGSSDSQDKASATISSLPSAVGYARTICWYNGDALIGTTSISSSSTVTSYTQEFTGLLPNTTYTLKAIIRAGDSSGSALCTKTVAITTPQETGTLTVTPQSTYLTAQVSGMFDEPNYDRTIEIWYRRQGDADYVLFTTLTEQGTTASANITGLISNATYDVKALIKNGTITLKELVKEGVTTVQDTSLIPMPEIESITQQLGTRNCTITWLTNKAVAGTTYTIQAKAEDDAVWTTLETLSDVTSPIVVVAHTGNEDVAFRISAVNEAVASSTVNYSDEYDFYVRDDFVWDIAKSQGSAMTITANEWNRLREYAIARNSDIGNTVNIPTVKVGDPITAQAYNTMKNAISQVTEISIADKARGDAIKAADVDALRIAINTVA